MTTHAAAGADRGRPRDSSIDGRILRAAVELIVEQGPSAVTVDDVARQAETSKATVYRRWPRKEHLLEGTVRSALALAPPTVDVSDPRAALVSLVDHWLRLAAEEPIWEVLFRSFGAAEHPPGYDRVREAVIARHLTDPVTTILRRAESPAAPQLVSDLFLGLSLVKRAFRNARERQSYAESAVNLIWPGLQAGAARPAPTE